MNKQSSMPASRAGGVFKLVFIFVCEIAMIVVLHLLGNVENMSIDFANFSQWINTTPPEIALVASIRVLALVFSYWLIVTSFLYMAARAFNLPILIRALEITTIPGVRRLIDAGLAAAIVGGTVFGGAGAVFAKSTHAQTNSVAAGVTATINSSRSLYNPVPAGDATGPVVSFSNTGGGTSKVVIPSAATESQLKTGTPNQKYVINKSDNQTVSSQTESVTQDKDSNGNWIPIPAGNGGTDSTPVAEDSREHSKVVIDPQPADGSSTTTTTTSPESSTTTTTSPKVVVPPTNTTPPVVTVEGQQVTRSDETAPAQTPAASSSYTVESGDNFWAIAENQVRNSLGREPTDSEVANYWVKLIDANRSNIRSGDPDLIYPGEVFILPPV